MCTLHKKRKLSALKNPMENIYRTSAKCHREGLLERKKFTVPKFQRYEGYVNISVNIPHSNLKDYIGPHVEGRALHYLDFMTTLAKNINKIPSFIRVSIIFHKKFHGFFDKF